MLRRLLLILSFFIIFELSLPDKASAIQNVIGVRVIQNAGDLAQYPHTYINGILSPLEWYLENVPNPGEPEALEVDGYPAIRDGRTIYVAAVNKVGDKLYSNIYLISFNEGAQQEVLEILGQLIRTWRFNSNIGEEIDPEGLVKKSIQEDLRRVMEINDLRRILEDYKKGKKVYPDLRAGSYQTGWSFSVWPSWQETLGRELGKDIPIDPENKFFGCRAEDVDPVTCWNERSKQFFCPTGAQVYGYRSMENGDSYELYANFEYKGEGSWQGVVDNPLDSAGCFFFKTADTTDNDRDGIPNSLDICPSGDRFGDIACSEDQKFAFVTVDQLAPGETCFQLRNRPGICYQPQSGDPERRTNAQCDRDRDGVGDGCDECPLDPENDRDRDGLCIGGVFRGVESGGTKRGGEDNCPLAPNPDQRNTDERQEIESGRPLLGDACSGDIGTCGNGEKEGFEVCDFRDNTPSNAECQDNCDQWICNRFFISAAEGCLSDKDEDTVIDTADNCVDDANEDQLNVDGDAYGDICDWCPDDPANDADGDGVCAGPRFSSPEKSGAKDNCVLSSNTDQSDRDADGVGDVCDCCFYDPDNDIDGDGVCACPAKENGKCTVNTGSLDCSIRFSGAADLCPFISDALQTNTDAQLEKEFGWAPLGDVCDADTCGDGRVTGIEQCDPLESKPPNYNEATWKARLTLCKRDCQLLPQDSPCNNKGPKGESLGVGCYVDKIRVGGGGIGITEPDECQKGVFLCQNNKLVCADVFDKAIHDYCCAAPTDPASKEINQKAEFADGLIGDKPFVIVRAGVEDLVPISGPVAFSPGLPALKKGFRCDDICGKTNRVCVGVGFTNPKTNACVYVRDDAFSTPGGCNNNGIATISMNLSANQASTNCKSFFGMDYYTGDRIQPSYSNHYSTGYDKYEYYCRANDPYSYWRTAGSIYSPMPNDVNSNVCGLCKPYGVTGVSTCSGFANLDNARGKTPVYQENPGDTCAYHGYDLLETACYCL
ncbi:MAG: hypothetical protein G01um101418_656 [Parcubacteria group bacterium Gr01-1014_18]|nr:MAG: hypothetical protein Greene041636_633 [Parcubacteria group bacterium Greene0416_36]TSC80737.1 MAG: hypothetical protein G01um101418_656 [Parcubacteria group bacterium Gr01-1014_18]TSC98652.1 MAG: hypothetical protein Greene101420_611 [Parcubacteria group bacterium Greene1014_20]TSD07188.1 MAG: hypothetical protein Greene07142_357 [Parcubacteria group bacterium Greene0714_2]